VVYLPMHLLGSQRESNLAMPEKVLPDKFLPEKVPLDKALPEKAIEILGLKRGFGKPGEKTYVEAVSEMDFSVDRGEMFGIVGPDGAGKTTLIRLLCGILTPSAGTAKILGFDLLKNTEELKRHIGYLSQRFSLYTDLTVDENIEFFAEIHEVKGYEARRDELLEFTRLTPFRNRLADKLSGGMKQKLALACTLIHKPEIIFLDEPTTGVDPVSRRDFWKILSSLLHEGITIVMATPYLDEAERCTRVALVNNGKLMIADAPKRIKDTVKGTMVEIVCAEVRRAYTLLKAQTETSNVQAFGDRLNVKLEDPARELPHILRTLEQANIVVEQTRTVPVSLENVFISLMSAA
jgi:ABC-2 type transport system ATP-binding protein